VEPRLRYADRSSEEQLLADLGTVLRAQIDEIEVRLPVELATRCVAAWERDDLSAIPDDETQAERTSRHPAGVAALIGLAVKARGVTRRTEVIVNLDIAVGHVAAEGA